MRTLAEACRYEETVRKSRFIAHAARVRSERESLAFYESVADPQATHNCWAWRIDYRCRFNDDGEPGGTAGRPMLAAIEARELDQVMVIVTRHYGGIKLGIGGLRRAYGGAAARCLEQAPVREVVPATRCRVSADFALAEALHQLLDRFGASKSGEEFENGGYRLRFVLPNDQVRAFESALAEVSRGRARLERG